MTENSKRTGHRLEKYGNLGVHFHCSGPDPRGPIPGEHFIIVIYDTGDQIVRRLEEVTGRCIDPGYVDYFLSSRCRPAIYEHHIVDTDRDGNKQILATHSNPLDAKAWLEVNFPHWVSRHGIPQ